MRLLVEFWRNRDALLCIAVFHAELLETALRIVEQRARI